MADLAERAPVQTKQPAPARTSSASNHDALGRRAADREAGYSALLNARPPGPRPIQRAGKPDQAPAGSAELRDRPTISGAPVVQRIAWHDKDKDKGGSAGVKGGKVPAINGVTNVGGTTQISVAGYQFTGPLYALDEATGADKTTVVTKIAAAVGGVDHPKSDKFLRKSQLASIKVAQTLAPDAINGAIADGNHRNVYRGAIDPYIVRGPGLTDDGDKIALHYQFGVDSYGYTVKIEQEGKTYDMHGERGQDALAGEQGKKLDENKVEDPLFEQFASAHDTGSADESISEVASKSTTAGGDLQPNETQANLAKLKEKGKRLDAVTKIGGEGARWVCVREHAKNGKLANGSLFYRDDPNDEAGSIGMTFQTLWGCWADLFGSGFNIPDGKVAEIILARHQANDNRIVSRKKADLKNADYKVG